VKELNLGTAVLSELSNYLQKILHNYHFLGFRVFILERQTNNSPITDLLGTSEFITKLSTIMTVSDIPDCHYFLSVPPKCNATLHILLHEN
jgi:hypothetical protein